MIILTMMINHMMVYDDKSYDGVIVDPIYGDELDDDCDEEPVLPIWGMYEYDDDIHDKFFAISQDNGVDYKINFDEYQDYEEEPPFVNDVHIGILEDVDLEDDILKGVDLTDIILEGVGVANDLLKTTYEKRLHM